MVRGSTIQNNSIRFRKNKEINEFVFKIKFLGIGVHAFIYYA